MLTTLIPADLRQPARRVTATPLVSLSAIVILALGNYATFDALAAMRNTIDGSAVFFSEALTLGRGQGARRLESVAHSRDYFTVLGVEPLLGSWTETGVTQRDDAAVISYGLWKREFGGAPNVLGQPLRLGLDTYTIVAVAPRDFGGLAAWFPARRAAQVDPVVALRTE